MYSDGACARNGRRDARAGIGVYFGDGDPRNVSELVTPDERATNNVAELVALMRACELAVNVNTPSPSHDADEREPPHAIVIVTDSKYAILCASSYGLKCANAGWPSSVPNRALVRRCHEMFAARPNVRLQHVRAHTRRTDAHSRGNAAADALARRAVERRTTSGFFRDRPS